MLFHVPSMPDYGALSKRPLDEIEAGARVDVAPYKRSPLDFVLWKPAKPGEPAWPSPVGIAAPGRPGWHIECSAMSWKHLGKVFDIHGGGIDLVFPHHENEIAQTRCAFDTPRMANVWMHNGFLQVEGDKMSKSLGNFVTIRELLDGWQGYGWPGEAIRFAMFRAHYRQPIDFGLQSLEEAHKALWDFYGLLEGVEADGSEPHPSVMEALADDLNTPAAIAALFELRHRGELQALARSLRFFGFSLKRETIVRNARTAAEAAAGPAIDALLRHARRRARKGTWPIRPHPRRTFRHGICREGQQGRHDNGEGRGDGTRTRTLLPLAGRSWRWGCMRFAGSRRRPHPRPNPPRKGEGTRARLGE